MITIIDRSGDFLDDFNTKKRQALIAMGMTAKQLIQLNMETGYGSPIRDTGNLISSIAYGEPQSNSVKVGTNVEYAPYVHEGTYKMVGRPFIKDALQDSTAQSAIADVAAQILSTR